MNKITVPNQDYRVVTVQYEDIYRHTTTTNLYLLPEKDEHGRILTEKLHRQAFLDIMKDSSGTVAIMSMKILNVERFPFNL